MISHVTKFLPAVLTRVKVNSMNTTLIPRVRFLSPVARRLQLRRAWSDELRRLAKLAGLYPKSVR